VYASLEIERAKVLQAKERPLSQDKYFGNGYIIIKDPQKNATIKNPVYVSGMANVYEGNVRINIKEGSNILSSTFLTAEGTGGKLYNFNGNVAYSFPEGTNGSIDIFEEDPKNNKDKNVVTIPVKFEDNSSLIKWETFTDNVSGYSFEYPSFLKLTAISGKDTSVFHSILYKHGNLCIDKKSPETTLSEIKDFYVSTSSINQNIANTIKLKDDIDDLSNSKIKKIEINGRNVYVIDNTEKDCGTIHYFIELKKNKTVFIEKLSVPEIRKYFEIYSTLKNIILPTKDDYVFNRMLSSIQSID